ncbi:S53 family peptidase [Trebonia kvetii]|uniref:S53 family peptidase n=1 Tax=Trebonia kvetii TaxID=2480626 RepID=UPI001C9E7895|nr:S53 family peptidase [Trebonia kvetii]
MRRLPALAAVTVLGSACAITAFGTANAASGKAVLAGSIPAWANSKNLVGTADPAGDVGFRVYLGWNDPAAVASLAAAVSDPSSASYRKFLTPAQFRQQFAPSQAQVGAVQSWLKSQGFSVEYTPQNNHYVSAEGTVAQAEAAFGTTFGEYSVSGLTVRSPEANVAIPDSLSGIVTGVAGLDDSAQFVQTDHTNGDAPPPAAFVSAQPCSAYWGEKQATGFTNPYGSGTLPYAPCGYTPQQVKGAYGISGYDGSGQTVAIIDAYAAPTLAADVNQWSVNRGLPTMSGSQLTQVVAPGTYHHPESGKKQDPQGWYGEETLDAEAVHGMAPAAKIVYVGAPNNFQDLDAALNNVVDKHLADIVTNSYGWDTEQLPPGFIKPYEDTMMQGVIEGIGIYFSSGDNSDESQVVGYRTADWPASSPFVTSVGGTTLGVGASNNYLFETGWGTTTSTWNGTAWASTPPGPWLYGAGGGVSTLFAEPSYQQGVVPAGVFAAQGRTGRAVPDIAALADPNAGYLIGETQTFPDGTAKYSEYRIGGTSLASPIVAGIMALANQAAGQPLGFVNPLLYKLAGSAAFNDVVSPSATIAVVRSNYKNSVDATGGLSYVLRTANQTLSLQTTPGYDDVTGLGTPTSSFLSMISK